MATKEIKGILVPDEVVNSKIYQLRGQKVMLDADLAELYAVENKQLKRQVRRNIDRFPDDFMFVLTQSELENLRSQFDSSSWGGTRYPPMAFTEQGVAMLSSVLNSAVSIQVNIQIIRIFTKMRELLLTNKDILLKLEKMEKKVGNNSDKIEVIFKAIKKLLTKTVEPRKPIGYKQGKGS